MVDHELLRDEGILVIRPRDSLEAADFQSIAQQVDPYIEAKGKLDGVLIDAPAFPGWKDFSALIAHLKFVKDHHRKIERVAIVTDDGVLRLAPRIAEHFAHPAFKVFGSSDADRAFAWLQAETGP